jgi:fructokinase
VKLENGHARYSFFDDNSAGRMLTRRDLPRLSTEVEALHFGSISLIPDPGAATFEALMARETRKRVICLDPNIRSGQIKDRRSYLARINRLTAMTDILKISDEDVQWIAGSDDLPRFARSALRRGARLVVVTRGGKGVEVFSKRFHFAQPARTVSVADTVGAGDTFTAGLLAALRKVGKLTKVALATIDQDSLGEATVYAARAAAVTVSRPGADPPWAHEMA